MKRQTRLIRYDKEFYSSIATLKDQLSCKEPLPLGINGLSDGIANAYLAEALFELSESGAQPSLVIVPSDKERERICSFLSSVGLKAFEYKSREFVFHNISASHDTERERLFVLSKILSGECDVVVTTPSAALAYTMPRKTLESL